MSLEHAHKINLFFNHDTEASIYLLSMVNLSRAGTFELQKFLREQMRDQREKQMQIHKVVKKFELNRDDLLFYYSNWLAISVHLLSGIDKFQEPEAMRTKLGASEPEFLETINFLSRTGLIVMKEGRITTGEAHVHLKKNRAHRSIGHHADQTQSFRKTQAIQPSLGELHFEFYNFKSGLRVAA